METSKEQLDRSIRGELSPTEARELAQRALDDEELFDALEAHGLVEGALQSPEIQAALETPSVGAIRRFPSRARIVAMGAIAAGIALVAIYAWRWASPPTRQEIAALKPSLDLFANGPILLAADLQSNATPTTPVFRGAETDSRLPRNQGTLADVEGQEATINLGLLDGVTKGSELDIYRGDHSEPVGRISMRAVFRESARGQVIRGAVRTGDRVRVDGPAYLAAVLEEVNSLASQGDSAKARALAKGALASVPGSSAAARSVWQRLGVLDYQAGDTAAAESDYQSAIASFPSSPSAPPAAQAATLNSLAAIYLLRGDYAQAEARLNQARSQAPGSAATLNNLAILAELRGDKKAAQTFYQDARQNSDAASRAAIERNLSRVQK